MADGLPAETPLTYTPGLRCPNCGAQYTAGVHVHGCPACRTEQYVTNLEVTYDFAAIGAALTPDTLASRPPTMWRYAELLPVRDPAHRVSLGEGMTPLIAVPTLGQWLGVPRLYLKNESHNPTWSFKDRLCSVAVSMALELGARGIVASSTGNHGAAAAAYAARAGLPCVILTLPGVPETMKVLMQAYGAFVVATPTSTDRWTLMAELVERSGWFPVTNFTAPPVGSNPYGVEGHKTLAFEMADQLGWRPPDVVVSPTSYADGLAGMWKGFTELCRLGWTDRRPRMVAAEPFGPLANALHKGLAHVEAVPGDESVAHSIASTMSAVQGLRALRESAGEAVQVTDAEIMTFQLELARREGLYVEPSSAAAVAALAKLVKSGGLDPGQVVVILATSSGLKNPAATRAYLPEIPVIEPRRSDLVAAVERVYGYDLDS